MRNSTIIAVLAPCLAATAVRAEDLWVYNQEFVLDGCARVYDGGPEECIFLDFDGPVPEHHAGVEDLTRPGTLGALSSVGARAYLVFFDETLAVGVKYSAYHIASLFPGGDRPGGEAQGSLLSVIEFVMPADELEWTYAARITTSSGFEGSTAVTVENVTRSETLLSLIDDPYENGETVLTGSAGDLIRITSQMSGGGSIPPDVMTIGKYKTTMDMIFTIVPEPTTLSTLLVLAAPLILRRRLSSAYSASLR